MHIDLGTLFKATEFLDIAAFPGHHIVSGCVNHRIAALVLVGIVCRDGEPGHLVLCKGLKFHVSHSPPDFNSVQLFHKAFH